MRLRFWMALLVNVTVSACGAILISEAMARIWFIYAYWQLIRTTFIAMLISVALMYLLRCHAGTLQLPYADAVSGMHRYIRSRGLVCTRSEGTFVVRLGEYASAKIYVRSGRDGVEVHFAPYATHRGRGLVVILAVLAYTLPVALAMSLRFALSARLFASEALAYLSSPERLSAESATRETTRELLETSLTEARRIALETYEARRSDYQGYTLLVMMGCIMTAILGLIFIILLRGHDVTDDLQWWLLGSLAPTFAAFAAAFWALRRRMKPEIDALRGWVTRLEVQLAIETLESPLDDQDETSFEVLAAVGKELPEWLSRKRRSGSFFYPFTTMAIVVLAYLTFTFVMSGISWQPFEIRSALSFLAAGVTATSAFLLYYHVKGRVAEERAKFCDGWKSRWEAMMSDSERLLGGR